MKFNKTILVFSVFLLVMSINVFGILNDNITAYYNFNELSGNAITSVGLFNLTDKGTTPSTIGLINNSRGIFSSNNFFYNCTMPMLNQTFNYTINTWIKGNTTANQEYYVVYGNANGNDVDLEIQRGSNGNITFSAWGNSIQLIASPYSDKWTMFTIIYDGSIGNFSAYVNGTYINTTIRGSQNVYCSNAYLHIGMLRSGTSSCSCGGAGIAGYQASQSLIDETGIWNKTLTQSELIQLYNTGIGLTYPFITNFTIKNKNNYNLQTINNFSVLINGTTYNTTNGTIITPYLNNLTSLINITIISDNMFNKTYINQNISTSTNLLATQDQYPIIYLINKWNNSNITNTTVFIDGNNYNTTTTLIYVPYNITKIITTFTINYLNITQNLILLQNTLTQINISQSIINFSLKEFDSNISLSNFSLNITGYGIACNTTNSSCLIYPNGNTTYNYSVIDNSGIDLYHLVNNTLTVNYLDNYTYYAYVHEHYINVTAKNIITNASISNFSIHLVDFDQTDVRDFNTTTGFILIPVVHQAYNLTINSSGYVISSIIINMTNPAINIINQSFLLYKTNSILFTMYDSQTLQKINNTITTITLQGTTYTYQNTTTNGTLYQDGFVSDTYFTTLINPSYTGLTTLFITLNGGNNIIQNIYLDNQSTLKIFTIKDNNGFPVSEANINVYKASQNGTLAITQITTDPTGSASFYLNSNIYYQFIITKTGFDTLDTSFIPALSSYQLTLFKSGSGLIQSAYDDVSYQTNMVYNPTTTIATLTYLITSNSGALSYYGNNITYNGINQFTNISNQPQGSIITTNININNASIRTIKAYFFFKHINHTQINWTANYYIDNVVASNYTLLSGLLDDIPSIENVTYIYGKPNVQPKDNPQIISVIAGMIIIIFFVIIGSVFGIQGALFGGVIGLGINLFNNFLPFYLTLLSFIIIIFIWIAEGMGN